MNYLTLLILAVGLVLLSVGGLALSLLIRKGGKFPNTHVSGNRHLKEQGIDCATTQDRMEQAKARKKPDYKKLSLAHGKTQDSPRPFISEGNR